MGTGDGKTGTNLPGIGHRCIRRFFCRHLQGPELHRDGIGSGFQEYSEVSTFSDQGDVSTKPLDQTMIEMTHQHHWPMELLEQASGGEPQPLLVCQYCGFVRDDEPREHNRTAAWIAMAAYRRKRAVQLRDVPFVHTYCPTCLPRIQGTQLALHGLETTAPVYTSIRTRLRTWIDRGWRTLTNGLVERKRRR